MSSALRENRRNEWLDGSLPSVFFRRLTTDGLFRSLVVAVALGPLVSLVACGSNESSLRYEVAPLAQTALRCPQDQIITRCVDSKCYTADAVGCGQAVRYAYSDTGWIQARPPAVPDIPAALPVQSNRGPKGPLNGPRTVLMDPHGIAEMPMEAGMCAGEDGIAGVVRCFMGPAVARKSVATMRRNLAQISSSMRETRSPLLPCDDSLVLKIVGFRQLSGKREGFLLTTKAYIFTYELDLEARVGDNVINRTTTQIRARLEMPQGVLSESGVLGLVSRHAELSETNSVIGPFLGRAVRDYQSARPAPIAGEAPNDSSARCLLMEANMQARTERFTPAEDTVLRLVDLCKGGCDPKYKVTAVVLLGTLRARSDRENAIKLFSKALQADRKVALDPAIATPAAVAAFKAAQAALPLEEMAPLPAAPSPPNTPAR